ncbi:hypothetical protein CBM2609_U20010 [Cupriavidus taiwanensis]|nr:hypothetical protein CBM2604_U20012 [Cupriavidus taiwanensis]SOZ34510.1 hypothetical protein CBM2609_U20010 [Cupriavidus taiwanensis]
MPDSLKIPFTPVSIGVPFEVSDVGRVIHQLVTTDARQTNEISQVAFKHLKRILKRDQDICVQQEP